jgi:hypothetical protein
LKNEEVIAATSFSADSVLNEDQILGGLEGHSVMQTIAERAESSED